MNKETKSPTNLMADVLAEMTARAIEAERQRDEERKNADNWYQYFDNMRKKCETLTNELETVRSELNEAKAVLASLRQQEQEGESNAES